MNNDGKVPIPPRNEKYKKETKKVERKEALKIARKEKLKKEKEKKIQGYVCTPLNTMKKNVMHILQVTNQLSFPPPMKQVSTSARIAHQFYAYHNDHGHINELFCPLNKVIKDMIRRGQLKQYLAEPMKFYPELASSSEKD